MALNNSQYDEIFRSYDAKQLKAQHQLEERTKAAYERSPELKALDASIAEISVASARRLLDGDSSALTELKAELKNLRTRKKALMKELSLPENYFEPVYECPDCKDTGYIDGKPCQCFKQQAIDLIYTQSNIKDILARENFSTLSLDYYSDSNINPATGLTSCIAKELLDSGHSVIYFTAFQLFDILSKGVFEKDADAIATHQNIFDCDLLIIDDLGTELSNSFTTSQLFLCLNERILRQKSTIISTNLNMNQVADIYSERVLSRISNSYTIIKLFGDDIRLKKRIH